MAPEITYVCWKWGRKRRRPLYTSVHVNALWGMLQAQSSGVFRLLCLTDDATGLHPDIQAMEIPPVCRKLPDHFRKLYLFSREFAEAVPGRVAHLDLDVVVTGDLTPLTQDSAPFRIIRRDKIWYKQLKMMALGRNRYGNVHFNSSFYVLQTGAFPQVWEDFDPDRARALAKAKDLSGTDQAWLTHCLAGQEVPLGQAEGCYRYSDLRGKGHNLPDNCRLVFFPGATVKPWAPEMQKQAPWIRDYVQYEEREG